MAVVFEQIQAQCSMFLRSYIRKNQSMFRWITEEDSEAVTNSLWRGKMYVYAFLRKLEQA